MPDSLSNRVRIAIVDDHEIFRAGLRRLLESERDFDVVAEASNGAEALRTVADAGVDLVLLDVAMPTMSGLEALPGLMASGARVVLLTAAVEPADLLKALQSGVRGVVLKASAPSLLIDGIHRVMQGKYLIGAGVADDLAHAVGRVAVSPATRYSLTPREMDIVTAIVTGASNRDIADRFSISLQTVKHHLTNIFDKTGVSTRLELALLAIRQGLVDSD